MMSWFEGWASIGRTALTALIAYSALVFFLRTSGKRTLTKLNAFDLVVTVALGSTLASIVTSDRLPIANGLLALALLIAFQYAVAWLNLRAGWFRRLVKSDPTLLVYDGHLIDDALRRSRVGHDEILSAVRGSGIMQLEDVRAVVLEPDGSLSVLTGGRLGGERTTLRDVQGLTGRIDAGVERG